MACAFILLSVVLTVPGVFTMVQPDRHQGKTSTTTTAAPFTTTTTAPIPAVGCHGPDGSFIPPGSPIPTGPNCYAMGTIIPAGRDVQVNGYTCRCPDLDTLGVPFGKRSSVARRELRYNSAIWGDCSQYLQATCKQ
ncbi:Hypp3218 [Branchiostoma lanceolatum]|uniref:Hypp3218 protein n=1 Tax=Branchiostoma lanceolatum TaxID=7740 RepID=A0A8K0EWC9_BRALA|nr:Hypp3218 [Branchiostoma lanceolatum]